MIKIQTDKNTTILAENYATLNLESGHTKGRGVWLSPGVTEAPQLVGES